MRLRILSRPSSAALEAISARPSMRSWPSSSAASSSFTFAEIASMQSRQEWQHQQPSPPVPSAHELEASTSLSAHSVQNHACQTHAFGHYGSETRRRAADIWVPCEANRGDDRRRDDHCRLHSRLLLHMLRPGLPLTCNRPFHFPITAPPGAAFWNQACMTVCRGIFRRGDSVWSLRRADTEPQSMNLAWCPLAPGYSHHISCSGS